MMTLTMAGKRISTETTNRSITLRSVDLLTPEKLIRTLTFAASST